MQLVFKICTEEEWGQACRSGKYCGSKADLADGFIHLSAASQVRGTAARHFAGQPGLVLVAFNDASIEGLKWEASRQGQMFPHVYGTLSTSRALWVKPLPLEGGRHRFPEGIPA